MLIPILALTLGEVVALKGATVHTFEPGEAPAVRTVLVDKDRIRAVGAEVEIPSGARVVDLTGLHLLPGLVDGMVNFDADHDRLYLSAGVTLVRDVGNDYGRLEIERTRTARERHPGPWIWSAGAVLDGAPPSTFAAVVLDDAEAAQQKLAILFGAENPPDYLSFLPGVPRSAFEAVLTKAAQERRQVWGTLPRGLTLATAIELGQAGVFHLDAFLPAGKTWESVTLEELAPAVELAAARGVRVTPTLAIWGRAIVPPKPKAEELDLLSSFYHETWVQDAAARERLATKEHLERGLAILRKQQTLVKALHEQGVALVPGSAAPNPWLFPGTALLDELALWRAAGIPVEDCVRAATANACRALGIEYRGTIRAAHVADLIAVRADPTRDLAALHRPEVVVVRGRVFDRAQLDALEAELRAAQSKARAALAQPIEVEPPELPEGDVILKGRVETRAIGVRVSGERFAVVRRFDGALVYVGRVRTPGGASHPDTETLVEQVIADGVLASFDVSIRTGVRVVDVEGQSAGGRMNVSVKLDGLPVRNDPVLKQLALVDCGSATAWLVLGYHRRPGAFSALFFDDVDPAFGPWELALDPDGSTHYLRILGAQQAIVRYDERGFPTEVERLSGRGISKTILLESEVLDGRGLPMPADKKALAPKARPAPVPAGSGAPR